MYQLTKKRNPVLKFLGFLLAISITLELLKAIFGSPTIDEQMMNTAKEINKNCPIMVDSITRLDNTLALPNDKFQFNYTFIKNDKADVDTAFFQTNMKQSIINSLTTDPKFKIFKENDISLSATFYDSTGKYICNIFVNPYEYKKRD